MNTDITATTTYTKTDVIKARETLTRLRNLSIIMNLLFQTPKAIMEDKTCTMDKALEQQEKAYNYVKKYGILHTKDTVEKTKPIIDQLLYDIIKQEKENNNNSSNKY